jgi:Ni,Fe-hydrogenase III large subunit
MVLEAVPHLGYLHRCKEKIAENLAYYQYVGYTDRLDYLAAMNNNHAWAMAVEKLAGVEVPERAEYIRVIASELNRIASHLVSFGTYGLDMGAFTPFLYAFREREYILDLFEQMCGARLTLSYINLGGVHWDLPPMFCEKLEEFLDYFEPKIDEYNDLLSFNHIFVKRTANVGVCTKEQCIRYALSGPMIRGSGIPLDLRARPAVQRVPEAGVRRDRRLRHEGDAGRLLGPVLGQDAGDEAVLPDPAPGDQADPARAFSGQAAAEHEGPAGRGVLRIREPARAPRVLHRKPGRGGAVPRENPRTVLRQPRDHG